MIRSFIIMSLFLLAACGSEHSSNPEVLDASLGTASDGEAIYDSLNCNNCHGVDGIGPGVGGSLSGVSMSVAGSTIRSGTTGMAAYSQAQISTDDLNDLLAYIQQL